MEDWKRALRLCLPPISNLKMIIFKRRAGKLVDNPKLGQSNAAKTTDAGVQV